MNYEQHDNILLADWTFEGSLLGSSAEAELKKLEDLVETAHNLFAQGLIQAVLWIQKVPYSDFCPSWHEELRDTLLRDELRWRLGRIYYIRRSIQDSPFPWLYLTENDCLGALAELMFACQRRFVFDTETRFGFPELALGLLPGAGWLSFQIEKKPRLLELWNRQYVWKAEEAVQFGLIDAALSWKDWRLEMFAWARRQIEMWEMEASASQKRSLIWKPLEQLWPERMIPPEMRSQIQAYTGRTSRRLESQTGVDAELIDSVSHFILQAPYEAWLRRGLRSSRDLVKPISNELVYFDITESLPPISIVARILDSGFKVVFFAASSDVLKKNLEASMGQLEGRYRRHALQLFERQIAWYVGEKPRQPAFATLSFGYFRDVTLSFREWEIRGWVLTHQKMERQAVELEDQVGASSEILQLTKSFFETYYHVKNKVHHIPLIYLVKSLAIQTLVDYCIYSGESFDDVLEQLRGTEWKLLGSERHWERFLEYRSSLQDLSHIAVPEKLGSFQLNINILSLRDLAQIRAYCKRSTVSKGSRGPGFLHNILTEFSRVLSRDLVQQHHLDSALEASLYVTDALGYPPSWGGGDLYARRVGIRSSYSVKEAH